MVIVKLFGLLRLDTGIKSFETDASVVKDIYPALLEEARKRKPDTKVTAKDIDGCIAAVNGIQSKKTTRLNDGDVVMLMSPVCGG